MKVPISKFLATFIALAFLRSASHGQQIAGVPVTLPAYSMEAVGQPMDQDRTAVVVQSGGNQVRLVPAADTSIFKESNNSGAASNSLVMRDGRWVQALLKMDLSALTPNASVDKGAFHFKVEGVERSGTAVFNCYRMLVDWSEKATWFKPDPEKDATWNGLKAGVDFDAAPFATFQSPDLKKGDLIDIPGFETVIKGWQNGSLPNHGFLLTLNGKCLQASIPSRRAVCNGKEVLVGGAPSSRLIVRFDSSLIARVLLQPDDLLDATLRFRIAELKKARPGTILRVFSGAGNKALATVPLSGANPEGWVEVKGVLAAIAGNPSFSIEASSPINIVAMGDEKGRPQLDIIVKDHPKTVLFDHEIKPQPGVYNTIKDGHFYYGDKRLRLWGMVGYGEVDRLRKMGFNAQRVWDPSLTKIYKAKDFPADVAKRGELPPSVKGDGSNMDNADKHFADLKAHGMFVMFAGLSDSFPLKLLLADDSFIAGGDHWAEWKAAVESVKDDGDLKRFAVYFDDRLQKVRMKSAETLLNHVNPYTGQRYAEEENIAIYEVWNENGGVYRFLNEDRVLPPFFESEAQAKWSAWLRAKYKTESALRAAWGKLEQGETLENVKRAPSLAKANSYPDKRGRDYAEFLFDTVSGFDKSFRDYCRSFAPKGKGVNVVPFSFDTQYRPSVPWLHVDAQGDVNSHGMYFWSLKTSLDTPPAAYLIDSHTVEGMPTVLYETNQARPNPNRAEYPLKLAALASWQDWDGIFWHYWAAADMKNDEEYMAAVMPHMVPTHIWTGVDQEKDPVMTSAMALAGRIFLNYELKPAPEPTIYHVGKAGIFGFDLANGLGAGRATFLRGSRIKFENSETNVTIEKGVPDEPVRAAVKSGDQILWDWPNARLIIDAPSVKAYVGKVTAEPYKFSDGTVLSGISTPWVCWAMSSSDGKPLASATQAFVTALYDAKNTDFNFDWGVAGGPLDQAKAIKNRGRGPVLVDKVNYTLSFPTQLDYKFSGYDFATRRVVDSSMTGSNVLRIKDRELWMGVIDFGKRGSAAHAVVDANSGARKTVAADRQGNAESTDPKFAAVWNPLPEVSWGDTYAKAHRTLRESSVAFSSISSQDASNAVSKTINWSESQALFSAPANIDVFFKNNQMFRIAATFTRPPDMKVVVAAYEQKFGTPLEKVFTRQEEQSTARWSVKQAGATLDIKVTEMQGTQVITYELQR